MKQLNEYLINKQTKEKQSKMFLIIVDLQDKTVYFEIVDIISKTENYITIMSDTYSDMRELSLRKSNDTKFSYSYWLYGKDHRYYLLEKNDAIELLQNYLKKPAKDWYWSATPVKYNTNAMLDFIADLKEI